MGRTKAEIEADLERLQAELAENDKEFVETLEEQSEVIEEAIVAHEEQVQEAAEEVVAEITETVEAEAETVAAGSPLTDSEEVVQDDIETRVTQILADKYGLSPVAAVEVEVSETVADSEPAPVVTPVSEHWKNKKVFGKGN